MSQTKAQLINAVDGSIVTADLADDAVTAAKLAHTSVTAGSYTTADITIDAQGRITAAASGTISGAEIADQAVTNAKVNNSAAIAGTKISPDFGSQNIVTTGDFNSGSVTITGGSPAITFTDSNNDPDYYIQNNNGALRIFDATNSAERLVVNTDGHVDVTGNLDVGAGIDVTGAITGTTGLSIEGATVFNDAGADVDFRIEGDTDANLFYVNAGTNRVGIGTSGPNELLEVTGNCRLSSGGATRTLHMGPASAGIEYNVNGTTFIQGRTDAYPLAFKTQSADRMRIDSSGNVGIGTTSPGAKLKINGSSAYTVANSGQSVEGIDIQATAGGDGNFGGAISLGSSGSGRSAIAALQDGADADRTGLVFITHDSNTASANSEEKMRIDSFGNIGIGTTSPTKPSSSNTNTRFMEIASGDGADLILGNNVTTSISAGAHIGTLAFKNIDATDGTNVPHYAGIRCESGNTSGSMDLRFYGGRNNLETDVPNMILSATGNVGIGTASPSTIFTINHATNPSIRFEDSGTKVASINAEGTETNFASFEGKAIVFATSTSSAFTERMRIDTSGNVGIGTTSPDRKLDVSGTGNVYGKFQSTNATGAGIEVKDTSENWLIQADGGSVDGLAFYDSGRSAYRMVINDSGSVGIGTISPVAKLHVHNAGTGSGDHAYAYFTTGDTGATASDGLTIGVAATAVASISYREAADLTFGTNNAERMRIKSGGSIGIGTTNPSSKLSVVDDSGITIEATSTNTAGQLTIIGVNNSDQVSAISRIKSVSTDSSSAATATTFSNRNSSNAVNEHMRIDSSGKVGIGTTAPNKRLEIMEATYSAAVLRVNRSTNVDSTQRDFIEFMRGGTAVGFIKATNSSVAYLTSSDYRLKENAVAISDGITRLKTLKPYRFNFKAAPDTTIDGFFAHEVTAVPEAISGQKDAVEEDGSINPQGIDQSKLVPLLVAAVKELITKVEILEAA